MLNPTLTRLLRALLIREGGPKGPLFFFLSGNAEGAGEEACRSADENCSFEALWFREKKLPVLELCPVHLCGT